MTATEFEQARAEFGEPLHTRDYHVEIYRAGDNVMRLVGSLRDLNMQGFFSEDDGPIEMHNMVVVMDVEMPSLLILDCRSQMYMHPQDECPEILQTYQQIIGLSIARGFTKEVKARLGGPRGCAHVTMLIQAMAPVVWQAMHSFFPRPEGGSSWMLQENNTEGGNPKGVMDEMSLNMNRGMCHVFAEGGPMERRIEAGTSQLPRWIRHRVAQSEAGNLAAANAEFGHENGEEAKKEENA